MCSTCQCNDGGIFSGPCVCGQSLSTTTTTMTTYHTTSTTTTTTTTVPPCEQNSFTLTNNLATTNMVYELLDTDDNIIIQGFVLAGGTINRIFPCCEGELKVKIYQLNGQSFSTTAQVTQGSVNSYTYYNVTEIELGTDVLDCEDTTIVLNTPPVTTTTTTSTTTSTSTTSTTTTSTSTTSTTTSTTTTAFIGLQVSVLNNGTGTIGFNTQTWNIKDNVLPAPPTVTSLYGLTGDTAAPAATEVQYSGTFGTGQKSRLRYENTGSANIIVAIYFSINNGSSYTHLGSYDLLGYTGSGPYPFIENTYVTVPAPGSVNRIQFRIINF